MPLLGYYKLDEASMDSPDVAADSSGNANDGGYLGPDTGNSNTPVAGISGGAMQVNAPVTYPDPYDLAYHAGMRVNTADFSFQGVSPFTVDFWVKLGTTDAIQRRALLGSVNPSSPPGNYSTWGFYIEGGSTQVRFFRGDFDAVPNRDELITPSLTPGVWTNLKGIYTGTGMLLYMDDVLEDASPTAVTNVSNLASNLSVGAGVPLQVLFGFKSYRYPPDMTAFDEVKVYDSAVQSDSATIAYYGGEAE